MDKNSFLFKWMWLVCCFGTGNKRIWEYVNMHDTLDTAFDLIYNANARKSLNLTANEIKSAGAVSENAVSEMYDYCCKHDIEIICYSDENYPERLKSIFNPPAVLYCRGDILCIERELVLSVVGTRHPSEYSLRVTNALIKQLCGYELTIVSGFAVGIDIASHLAAVRNGGKTIAVLGSGLDYNYPADNNRYCTEICENGLFISEYYPKASPARYNFPARNRILSGLSVGTIVIEASKKSGSLVSANLALSHGRDIFCIPPHDLFDVRYQGNAGLLRDGAIPVMGLRDILNEYYENYSHKLTHTKAVEYIQKTAAGYDVKTPPDEPVNPVHYEKPGGSLPDSIPSSGSIYDSDIMQFDDETKSILAIMLKNNKPMRPDEISLIAAADISSILSILTALEIEGVIKASGNGYEVKRQMPYPL